jgi:hypothetical protein
MWWCAAQWVVSNVLRAMLSFKTSETTRSVAQRHLQGTWTFKLCFNWFSFLTVYSCHGRWEDNGTHYLITTPLSRSSRGPRRYCFMYREAQDGVVHFSSSSDSCRRNISPGIGGAMAFNVTSTGKLLQQRCVIVTTFTCFVKSDLRSDIDYQVMFFN